MTGLLRDLALAAGLVVYAVRKRLATGSRGARVSARNGRVAGLVRRAPGPRTLVHGVSVGETHALEPFVEALAASPLGPDVVVSASTATGFERARRIHTGRREVVRFPLDFTWMVARFLDGVRPELVVLGELELWPSFLAACGRRGIPVCVVNGRLSERSYRGYRRWRILARRMFRRLAWVSAQTEVYRDRFVALGVPGDRVVVG
ncbi:MAG: glycosyltransferase, partial [Gemmatimonadetes bacterium]|nr:glycosyltransferase [Gemmatimonadota bacterium]MYK67941.1 glycosyltransferase [Gemmatimonadota bacterium]